MRKQKPINKQTATYQSVKECFTLLMQRFNTRQFTWQEAADILNSPTRQIMINVGSRAGQIIKPHRGVFQLPFDFNPEIATETTIQFNRFESDIAARKKRAMNPKPQKNTNSFYVNAKPSCSPHEAIEKAITLLKSNGYKVLKPTTTFEEL